MLSTKLVVVIRGVWGDIHMLISSGLSSLSINGFWGFKVQTPMFSLDIVGSNYTIDCELSIRKVVENLIYIKLIF